MMTTKRSPRNCAAILLLLFLALAHALPSARSQTALWGEKGEAWDPKGILPDFSFAGYERGEKPLPEREPEVLAADFGVLPGKDVTSALQKLIDDHPGKCIRLGKGRYELSDRVRIQSGGTVLQGAGVDETVLFFTRGLEAIEPKPGTTGGGLATTQWSWSGGLVVVGDDAYEPSKAFSITAPAERGDKSFRVEEGHDLAAGDEVRIQVLDDPDGALTRYLYRDRSGDISVMKGHAAANQICRITAVEGGLIHLDRPLRFDLREAFKPTARRSVSKVTHCGVERLTIEFPSTPYRGHWMEDGLNGIVIWGQHNYARAIRIHNSDSGVYVNGRFNTVDQIHLTADRKPHASGNTGHHGLTPGGQDCLVTRFRIDTPFFHDITLNKGSIGNVISAGGGDDLCLDHHRYAPYENLFTDLDLGAGTRVWNSGGAGGKGLHTASGATFWNLRSKRKVPLPAAEFGPPGLVFAGLNFDTIRSADLVDGWHVEKLRPGSFQPANLHLAQLAARLAGAGPGAASAPAMQEWTNLEGRILKAEFLELRGENVRLRMESGQVFDYPMDKLNPASRKLAEGSGGR
jgi:hypothetical protein